MTTSTKSEYPWKYPPIEEMVRHRPLMKPPHLPQNRKTLIKGNPPKYVWYADSLAEEPRKISVEELEEIAGFQYFSGLTSHIPESELKFDLPDKDLQQSHIRIRNEALAMLEDPTPFYDNLKLVKVNDTVGIALFARKDLPFRTPVTPYSGLVLDRMEHPEYGHTFEYSLAYRGNNAKKSISSQIVGDYGRFMMHLPQPSKQVSRKIEQKWVNEAFENKDWKTLANLFIVPAIAKYGIIDKSVRSELIKVFVGIDLTGMGMGGENGPVDPSMPGDIHISPDFGQIKFDPSLGDVTHLIEFSNVDGHSAIIDGFSLSIYYTNRPIKAGEPLGFSYASGYWTSVNAFPQIFDHKMNPITKWSTHLVPVMSPISLTNTPPFLPISSAIDVGSLLRALQRNAVVCDLFQAVSPIPSFTLRNYLVTCQVLDPIYSAHPKNFFAKDLEAIFKPYFPKGMTVETYYDFNMDHEENEHVVHVRMILKSRWDTEILGELLKSFKKAPRIYSGWPIMIGPRIHEGFFARVNCHVDFYKKCLSELKANLPGPDSIQFQQICNKNYVANHTPKELFDFYVSKHPYPESVLKGIHDTYMLYKSKQSDILNGGNDEKYPHYCDSVGLDYLEAHYDNPLLMKDLCHRQIESFHPSLYPRALKVIEKHYHHLMKTKTRPGGINKKPQQAMKDISDQLRFNNQHQFSDSSTKSFVFDPFAMMAGGDPKAAMNDMMKSMIGRMPGVDQNMIDKMLKENFNSNSLPEPESSPTFDNIGDLFQHLNKIGMPKS